MFHDLSGVKSLFYMDSQKIVDEMPEHCSFTAFFARAKEEYSHFLPRILYGIQNLDDSLFYFDFHTLSYIPVKSGFISIMAQSAPSRKKPEISKIKLYQCSATLGLLVPRLFPEDYASMKDDVEAQIPRVRWETNMSVSAFEKNRWLPRIISLSAVRNVLHQVLARELVGNVTMKRSIWWMN